MLAPLIQKPKQTILQSACEEEKNQEYPNYSSPEWVRFSRIRQNLLTVYIYHEPYAQLLLKQTFPHGTSVHGRQWRFKGAQFN